MCWVFKDYCKRTKHFHDKLKCKFLKIYYHDFQCWHPRIRKIFEFSFNTIVFFLSTTFLNTLCLLLVLSMEDSVWAYDDATFSWGILWYLNKWSVFFSFSFFMSCSVIICVIFLYSVGWVLLNFPECSFSTLRVFLFLCLVSSFSCFLLSTILAFHHLFFPFSSWENFLCLFRNIFTVKKKIS